MKIMTILSGIAAVTIHSACCSGVRAQDHAVATSYPAQTPCMSVLSKFTAADVPVMAASETATPPLQGGRPAPANLPGSGLAEHPMLYIGEGCNQIFLINGGKIIWTYSTGPGWEYDDVWMLSNGNVLFTRMQYIAEITPSKQVVWRFDAPVGSEIHACQPIGLDKVLFVLNGKPPKLMVVDIHSGATQIEHDLPFNPQAGVHGQFRRVRYTAKGTYLLPFLQMDQVVEYDKNFNQVWKYPVKSPWSAIRLKNGNTLITDEKDVDTREVTPDQRIIWHVQPSDLPEGQRYIDTQSCTRLANGNTVICSRGGDGKGPQLVEVTPEKKVTWMLWDYRQLGPASAVQILDDPGVPEEPGMSEH